MRLPVAPENWPFDTVGPVMRPGLVQRGNDGGPFLVRHNPFSGLLDLVRGFCFPVATTEDESGGYLDDGSGEFASPSYADTAYPVVDFGGAFSGGSGPSATNCGVGTVYDPVLGQCTPRDMMMATAEPIEACGMEQLAMARQSLLTASQRCDRAGLSSVRAMADSCRRVAPRTMRPAWNLLYAESGRQLKGFDKRCAKIASRGNAEVAMLGTTAARMMMASASDLPMVADPTTLTEGNARMRAFGDPMGGTIDPERLPEVRRRPGFGVRR